jgi:ankyrin repeat protein
VNRYSGCNTLDQVRRFAPEADVHALESSSGRSALHKAAYWGHDQLTSVLLKEYQLDPNVQDNDGDSALHDAARFGHIKVCQHLIAAGCSKSLRNKSGEWRRCLVLL